MLKNTFIHIPGIGPVTERRLWDCGILDWDAVTRLRESRLSETRIRSILAHVQDSRRHLDEKNATYFASRLPSHEQWRLFAEFRDRTAYLDIETTGMDSWSDKITVVGLYDGSTLSQYVRGRNLDDFRSDIERYAVIVTYNGKCFDVPFIRGRMGLPMGQAHIDLRFVLAGLGLKGGLKACEKAVGIDRGPLDGLDGYDAVLLWYEYEHYEDHKALDTLLAYNATDVVNLEALMVTAYNVKLEDTPFRGINTLPGPACGIVDHARGGRPRC